MKQAMSSNTAGCLRRAMLMIVCGVFLTSAAYGQTGSGSPGGDGGCAVTRLRLRIATGGDDLRGGQNNLNIQILFAGGKTPQLALNVNKGANWPNNSVNMVDILLNQPVPPSQIIGLRLIHIADGSFNFASLPTALTPAGPIDIPKAIQTQDNWDMSLLQVAAIGNGVGARIAVHGFHRFTGSDPMLAVPTKVPADACGSGRPAPNSGGGSGLNPALDPGGSGLHPVTGSTGTGSRYGNVTRGVAPPATGGTQQWQRNKMVSQALVHTIQMGAKANAPSGFADGSNSELIGLLRRQSAAARALLIPAVAPVGTTPGGQSGKGSAPSMLAAPASGSANGALLKPSSDGSQGGTLLNGGTKTEGSNAPPYPPRGVSTPQVGPSQTMSSQGSVPVGTAPAASATPLVMNGPTRQNPAGGQHPAPSLLTRAATATRAQTQLCVNGIGSVDGQRSGVYFSPIAGPEGTFVIQGCGFGATPGEVYLSGLHYSPAQTSGSRGIIATREFPDRLSFQATPNAWGDRQIVATIDPNAGGFYDTNNVTLVVKTASGQLYEALGFNFAAAYDFQTLASLPQSPTAITVQLASVNDSSGGPVSPLFETPWLYSTPQHTVGVNRNIISWTLPGSYTFPGGTDTYQFHFAPGFRLANNGVQLYHSDFTAAECQMSPNGQFSASGNWAVNYTSPTSVQISWQEQGCWPTSNPGDALDYASVSAYSLWITVWGPRA